MAALDLALARSAGSTLAEECHKAICKTDYCPITPDGKLNGKNATMCEGIKPTRGYFVDKLEYTQAVQFPAPDASKYYDPEEYKLLLL